MASSTTRTSSATAPSQLNLSQKKLRQVPAEVLSTGGSLELLALHTNQLKELPPSFAAALPVLYTLNLSRNHFRQFPPQLLQLRGLQRLDISLNAIEALPEDFGTCTYTLVLLSVANNRLQQLPRILGQMPALTVLRVSGNPLRYPPKSLVKTERNKKNQTEEAFTSFLKKYLLETPRSAKEPRALPPLSPPPLEALIRPHDDSPATGASSAVDSDFPDDVSVGRSWASASDIDPMDVNLDWNDGDYDDDPENDAATQQALDAVQITGGSSRSSSKSENAAAVQSSPKPRSPATKKHAASSSASSALPSSSASSSPLPAPPDAAAKEGKTTRSIFLNPFSMFRRSRSNTTTSTKLPSSSSPPLAAPSAGSPARNKSRQRAFSDLNTTRSRKPAERATEPKTLEPLALAAGNPTASGKTSASKPGPLTALAIPPRLSADQTQGSATTPLTGEYEATPTLLSSLGGSTDSLDSNGSSSRLDPEHAAERHRQRVEAYRQAMNAERYMDQTIPEESNSPTSTQKKQARRNSSSRRSSKSKRSHHRSRSGQSEDRSDSLPELTTVDGSSQQQRQLSKRRQRSDSGVGGSSSSNGGNEGDGSIDAVSSDVAKMRVRRKESLPRSEEGAEGGGSLQKRRSKSVNDAIIARKDSQPEAQRSSPNPESPPTTSPDPQSSQVARRLLLNNMPHLLVPQDKRTSVVMTVNWGRDSPVVPDLLSSIAIPFSGLKPHPTAATVTRSDSGPRLSKTLSMPSTPDMQVVKFVILGNANVGKSAFIHSFTQGRFPPLLLPGNGDIQVVCHPMNLNFSDEQSSILLEMWELSGTPQNRLYYNGHLFPTLFENAAAVIVGFDLTDTNSAEDISTWFNLSAGYISVAHLFILGMKNDLFASQTTFVRNKMTVTSRRLAASHNADLTLCSSTEPKVIAEIMQRIVKKYFADHRRQMNKGILSRSLENIPS